MSSIILFVAMFILTATVLFALVAGFAFVAAFLLCKLGDILYEILRY